MTRNWFDWRWQLKLVGWVACVGVVSGGGDRTTDATHPWYIGDPIVEPQGVYRLPNGQLVLSCECS
ncbi:hypothetical protein [Gloeocapsopsis dulcis]|uniref:Uncharacterized protein n=1 Tax=Gloeocapsopsis dulcis AAB1 = 1H9 TaxID=1433147 RepID=A0A6N8FXY8_9CHRO|nr:hypothetical protein [Gloeocapsopsis dulcis]MUL37185.1 hypothetical protein [Gloeocapsopsis dulcis AAB1 = 1H9]WNN90206.1 hypothetical protein P0S91_03650 [Gloeocapsopsis dulcis]